MIKVAFVLALIVAGFVADIATAAATTQTAASVGGGVAHPWRSPYKTA